MLRAVSRTAFFDQAVASSSMKRVEGASAGSAGSPAGNP
jgi:hypothetical protein